jgi:hypothetical protein
MSFLQTEAMDSNQGKPTCAHAPITGENLAFNAS